MGNQESQPYTLPQTHSIGDVNHRACNVVKQILEEPVLFVSAETMNDLEYFAKHKMLPKKNAEALATVINDQFFDELLRWPNVLKYIASSLLRSNEEDAFLARSCLQRIRKGGKFEHLSNIALEQMSRDDIMKLYPELCYPSSPGRKVLEILENEWPYHVRDYREFVELTTPRSVSEATKTLSGQQTRSLQWSRLKDLEMRRLAGNPKDERHESLDYMPRQPYFQNDG